VRKLTEYFFLHFSLQSQANLLSLTSWAPFKWNWIVPSLFGLLSGKLPSVKQGAKSEWKTAVTSDKHIEIMMFFFCFLLWFLLYYFLCNVFLLFIFFIISVFHRPLCQQPLSPWKLQPEWQRGGGGAGLRLRLHWRLWGREVWSDLTGPAARRLGPCHSLCSWTGYPRRLHDFSRHSAATTNHSPLHHNTSTSHPAAMATQTWAEAAGCAVGGRQSETLITKFNFQLSDL